MKGEEKMPAIGISAIEIPPVVAAWARPGDRSVKSWASDRGPAGVPKAGTSLYAPHAQRGGYRYTASSADAKVNSKHGVPGPSWTMRRHALVPSSRFLASSRITRKAWARAE